LKSATEKYLAQAGRPKANGWEWGRDVQSGWEFCTESLQNSNPVQGARAGWLAQPGFRGESALGDECGRSLINSGVRAKNSAAKSSTMKGEKSLGSKF
jgi:hypothetical protein